jgi:hypothetical protein
VRTDRGKLARYAFWKDGTVEVDESKPIEYEAYDYGTWSGGLELDNVYGKRGSSRGDKASSGGSISCSTERRRTRSRSHCRPRSNRRRARRSPTGFS